MAGTYYPIAVGLKGKTVVIAGGGKVSQRKIDGLLGTGVHIRVVSPTLTPRLQKLTRSRKVAWRNKKIEPSDLDGADIVIAATSEGAINKKISRWAKRQGTLVNVVDRPAISDFISPAVLRKGRAILAVYTDGRDPVLSRDLKNFLKEHWDEFLSYRNGL